MVPSRKVPSSVESSFLLIGAANFCACCHFLRTSCSSCKSLSVLRANLSKESINSATSAKKLVCCNASPSFATPPSRYMRSCPSQRSFSLRPFSITSSHDFSLQRATPSINAVKFRILDLIWYRHFLHLLNFSSCHASSIAEFLCALAHMYTHFITTGSFHSMSTGLYRTAPLNLLI